MKIMDESGNFVRMADEKEVENILIQNRDAVGLARWKRWRKSGAPLESLELTIDTETRKIIIEDLASFVASILNATRN